MSKNFELLMQVSRDRKDGLPLAPVPVQPPAGPPHWLHSNANTPPGGDGQRLGVLLKRHWLLCGICTIAAVALAALGTALLKPTYAPVAHIEIDPPGSEVFSLNNNGATLDSAQYIETQARDLRNDQLAIAVIRKLHLDQNPEWVGKGRTQSPAQLRSSADAPEVTPAEDTALRRYFDHLTVKREADSRRVSISFSAHDPHLAAVVTNTLASLFVEDGERVRHEATLRSTEWLSRQLEDVRQKMEQSNRDLAEFQQATGIADVDENKNTFVEDMVDVSKQLEQARADRIQFEAVLNRLRTGSPESLAQVRDNPVVRQLTGQSGDVRAELAQAGVIYGYRHPHVRRLRSRLEELQTELQRQTAAIVGELRSSYTVALSREKLMESQKSNAAREFGKMARFIDLKKQARANTDLYNSLYSKVKEASIAASSKSTNVRIVDYARVLQKPTSPKWWPNLSIAALLGLLLGMALAMVREGSDDRVYTLEDVRQVLPRSEIATIPAIRAGAGSLVSHLRIADDPSCRKFLLDNPAAPEAEAVRALQMSIMMRQRESPPQAILVTSALSGAGKSTMAINLALALGRCGRTCLVDADLRRPAIAESFRLRTEFDVVDVLEGAAEWHRAALKVGETNLFVLPARAGFPVYSLQPAPTAELLGKLRQEFSYIILDSSPLLPFADPRMLATMVDGILLVERAGVTTREALTRSLEVLDEVHAAPVLEVVLNAVQTSTAEYSYYARKLEAAR